MLSQNFSAKKKVIYFFGDLCVVLGSLLLPERKKIIETRNFPTDRPYLAGPYARKTEFLSFMALCRNLTDVKMNSIVPLLNQANIEDFLLIIKTFFINLYNMTFFLSRLLMEEVHPSLPTYNSQFE